RSGHARTCRTGAAPRGRSRSRSGGACRGPWDPRGRLMELRRAVEPQTAPLSRALGLAPVQNSGFAVASRAAERIRDGSPQNARSLPPEPSVIAYDPSRTALYSPERAPTLFSAGMDPTLLQLATEASRLAYVRAEGPKAEAAR